MTVADRAADADIAFAAIAAAKPADVRSSPVFAEARSATLRRLALGALYPLRPVSIGLLPVMLGLTAEYLASPQSAARRLAAPKYRGWQGLVGVSEDMRPEAMLDAYRRGMFPFGHVGPMKWWSPAVRAVLYPHETRIEKNLRRLLRQERYAITFDRDFAAVMRACAEPRPGKTPLTWITPKMMRTFWALHEQGHAHSVEVWDGEGRLVGGLYGLAAGNVFFGESQFSVVRDASRIAVAALHCHLAHWGFCLRDAKWPTEHLASLGFREMPRDQFLAELSAHAWKPGRVGRWSLDPTLDLATWQTRR